jgi:hypothetical protein
MVVSVQAPFPIFCDANGVPIDGGYVYCGTENLNPITPANRIAVFSDAALTIALDNPVRTSGGYPIDASGNPCNIYADSQFSVSIADRNNIVRVSSPSYGFRVLSGAITFDTLVINTGVQPDAASGAFDGTTALPWSSSVSRAIQARTLNVYSQTQPTVAVLVRRLLLLFSPRPLCGSMGSISTPQEAQTPEMVPTSSSLKSQHRAPSIMLH